MKKHVRIAWLLLIGLSVTVFAQDKAVVEVSKTEGFKLSAAALKRIGAEFSPVRSDSGLTIASASLVRSLDRVGVYRLRAGWIKFVPVELVGKIGAQERVVSSEIRAGDQVAVQAAALLRTAEMEAFGGEE